MTETIREPGFLPYIGYRRYPPDEMLRRAQWIYTELSRRRTCREFAPASVPRAVIEQCLLSAGTAPNGANRQPWHFVVVSDADHKRRIRELAEREERAFYEHRATREWLDALAPLGTGPDKPFLETAPCLIAIFAQRYELRPDGTKARNYYVTESVGIATGMLIAALHHAGLATLTHTPSPMDFLNEILDRPTNERPFLLLVTGYPVDDVTVPDIRKKTLHEIATFIE